MYYLFKRCIVLPFILMYAHLYILKSEAYEYIKYLWTFQMEVS